MWYSMCSSQLGSVVEMFNFKHLCGCYKCINNFFMKGVLRESLKYSYLVCLEVL